MGTPDPTAPDPGPQPQEENLTPDQILAKYGADLTDDAKLMRQIVDDLVRDRKLQIAGARKSTAEKAVWDAWMVAYIKRYGTDEG